MWKNSLAICGIILFLGGVVGILALLHLVANGTANAVALDYTPPSSGFGPCPQVKMSANVSTRVMSESDTQALTVTVVNYCAGSQMVTVSLDAPEFSFSPSETDRTFPVVGSRSIDWILIPNKLGTFAISVSLDQSSQVIIGITVVNSFGLPLWLTQLLSSIAAFLGPVLAFPWWYDRWKERKKKKSRQGSSAGDTVKATKHNQKRRRRRYT